MGAKPDIMEGWAWGHSEEQFSSGLFATEAEAIAEGFSESEPGDNIYVGKGEIPDPTSLVDAHSVLENMIERNEHLFSGEWAEHWHPSEFKQSQIDDLNQRLCVAMKGWLDDNKLWPTFYTVDGSDAHEVPFEEEDVD